MKAQSLLLPAAAGLVAFQLLSGVSSHAYSIVGSPLDLDSRHARIYDNFLDAGANNNVTPDANFPGYTGAELACWKAFVEWGSEKHGNGNGDPSQNGGLGSGGANFDASFQGRASGIGSSADCIVSALDADGGGVIAYCESPGGDGWRIRCYENWSWDDGPGTNVSGMDLQGIITHEFGHGLGLGHSDGDSSATMYPYAVDPVGARSINADDINGVKAIYGTKSASKPKITAASSTPTGFVTITGSNFSATGNEVWFTKAGNGGGAAPVVKVAGVTSNGTTIAVQAPGNAGPGDVLVRNNGTGAANLSNAWPLDPGDPPGGGNAPPVVSSVSPSTVAAVSADGQVLTLAGLNFSTTTSVEVDGMPISVFPPLWQVVNDTSLTLTMPLVDQLGAVDVTVTNPHGSFTTQVTVVANDPPLVDLWYSNPSYLLNALGVKVTLGSAPGDLAFLCASPDAVASDLPGIASFALGNNFSTLVYLGLYSPDAQSGHVTVSFAIGNPLPIGTALHVQAGVFEIAGGTLPLTMTNVQSGTILF
jgi:hypothetical protein